MRFDASMESLINTGRSESFVDLADTDLALSRSVLSQSREMLLSYQGKYPIVSSYRGKKQEHNLNVNLN